MHTRSRNPQLLYINTLFSIEVLLAEIANDDRCLERVRDAGIPVAPETDKVLRSHQRRAHHKIVRHCRRFLRHSTDHEDRAVIAAHLVNTQQKIKEWSA